MPGSIVIGVNEIEILRRKMLAASQADLENVLGEIGQTLEDSARRRIAETKKSPEGKRWAPWSPAYAETRSAQHSLLRSTGNLLDSLTHQVDTSALEVEVGSNMVYAARHLFGDPLGTIRGGGRIVARPYLDTSGEIQDSHDRQEIREIVRDFMREALS